MPEPSYPSLILLDEFGKGTDEISGCSLLASILEYLSSISDQNKSSPVSPPIVLAISHMHSVFERFTGINKSSAIDFYSMDYVQDGQDEIKSLFKIVEGFSNKSFAIETCKALGIEEKIFERSK